MPSYATTALSPLCNVPVDKVQTILEQQVDRLNAHAQNANHLAERLHALADRTVGMRAGAEGTGGAPTPSPTHAIGKMEDAHTWIGHVIADLEAVVERLERL